MRINHPAIGCSGALAAVLISSHALAQDADAQGANDKPSSALVAQSGQPLPPPQSDYDPTPRPPGPTLGGETVGITQQAGIGGTQAYAREGVLELGGSANLTVAKDFTQFGFNPTVGWFFADNLEISGIVGLSYARASGDVPTATGTRRETNHATALSLLAEPSYHLPLSDKLFVFLGVGVGLAYRSDGPGTGFALAPRLGLNMLVGRSGLFSPAITAVYQTTDAISTPQGTVVAVSGTFGLQAGYTVMW